jgi:hypothetical protein
MICTLVRALNANAYAEHWVRTIREMGLDKLIFLYEAHLLRGIHDDVIYYNSADTHQVIDQRMPVTQPDKQQVGSIRCRNVLGIIKYRTAA